MKTIKIKTTGLSLLELRDKYPQHFYKQDWYDTELFANDKPLAGKYEFDFENKLVNKTYKEQKRALPKGFDFPHLATLVEALIIHFETTGERLLKDYYSATSSKTSAGDPSIVGSFGKNGLFVNVWNGIRYDDVGAGASRKLDTKNLKSLESLPLELIINGFTYKRA